MARPSKILDRYGEPYDLDALFGSPRAGPTLTGVRSPISGHPADGLTPARLAQMLRAAAEGDMEAYLELAEDMEERDLHYAAVLSTRKRQVAQLPINVEPASDDADHVRHADMIREWLAEGVLELALTDILDAVGKGFSVTEIIWDSTPELVAPRDLVYRPQRWFELDQVSLDEPVLRGGTVCEPLNPHKFIVHRHRSKSGLAIRGGLARPAAWAWMYKAFTARDWAVFVQNYGQPVRVGKYDTGATEADKEVLWRAVANIAGDCAAIIPKSMEIAFVEMGDVTRGADLYQTRCMYLDQQVSKLVLGQTATTDAIAGGHAVGQEHRLVQEDLERADAKQLSANLTRGLVRMMVDLNFGPQRKYPRLVIGRPDELPLGELVNAIEKLGPLGLEVEASQIYDRMGITEPAEQANGKPVRMVGGRPKPSVLPGLPGGAPLDAGAPPPAGMLTRHLVSLHASAPEPDYVDRLTSRFARDMEGAMAGLTDEIRAAFDAADSLHDLADRLERMQLDPSAFAEAMTRGMALAHLVGQAALLDELRGKPG